MFHRKIENHRRAVDEIELAHAPIEGINRSTIVVNLGICEIKLEIYRQCSQTHSTVLPTCVYIAGTGFVANEAKFTSYHCSFLAKYSHNQIICIRPPLSPEHKYPLPLLGTLAALHLLINQPIFRIDKQNLSLAGYSSGGNLAESIMSHLPTRYRSLINNVLLIDALLDLRPEAIELGCEIGDRLFTTGFMSWCVNHYLRYGSDAQLAAVSPVMNNLNTLTMSRPPTCLFFGSMSGAAHQNHLYFNKLKNAGFPALERPQRGWGHDFFWYSHVSIYAIAEYLHICNKPIPIPKELDFQDSQNAKFCAVSR